MRVLALVVARAGSKRVPGKNKRFLNGKPLITHSINHAFSSMYVKHIAVSSDDEQILKIAHDEGCISIPRPKELAEDKSQTIDAVLHALDYMKDLGQEYDVVVLLQPTVPFRPDGLIDKALSIMSSGDCDSVISHMLVDYFHPNRMKKIENGLVVPYCESEILNVARNELPKAYYRDGSIYVTLVSTLVSSHSFIGEKCKPLVVSSEDFVNIDTERDWLLAEVIAAEHQARNG